MIVGALMAPLRLSFYNALISPLFKDVLNKTHRVYEQLSISVLGV